MIEVHPNLFVGSQLDFVNKVRDGDDVRENWSVVHACKEPFHREALGYTGRGAPKDDPEYLFARRGRRLCLNLVDVDNVAYINRDLIEAALSFIEQELGEGRKVLVHCNLGHSRGPSVALLYKAKADPAFSAYDAAGAMEAFKALYPLYEPAGGMRGYIEQNWAA
ncbi:MAG TPA: hypothetical protein VNZ94_00475 [Xanthobacteraceae bacterium]|nr:hypothetical protein [Xanthobacteraceae bacterium]